MRHAVSAWLLVICVHMVVSTCQAFDFGEETILAGQTVDPRCVRLADMNDDGLADVVVTSSGNNTVSWFRNLGEANGFSSGIIIESEYLYPDAIECNDLDSDGDVDVLVAFRFSNRVSWYENMDGAGNQFQEHVVSDVLDQPTAVHIADMDSDGTMDVIVASDYIQNLVWFPNEQGDGEFSSLIGIALNSYSERIYACDIDNDQGMDILSVSLQTDEVRWYKNFGGQGQFFTDHLIAEIGGPTSIQCVDVDNDTDLDIVVAGTYNDEVVWYQNLDAQGTFSEEIEITDSVNNPWDLQCRDMNDDGHVDIVVLSNSDYTVELLLNSGSNGVFGEGVSIATIDTFYRSMDVSASGQGNSPVVATIASNNIVAFHSEFEGSWMTREITSSAEGVRIAVSADMDQDGDLDVIASSNEEEKLLWMSNLDSAGRFGPSHDVPLEWNDHFRAVAVADLDGDQDLDVIGAGLDLKWFRNENESDELTFVEELASGLGYIETIIPMFINGDDSVDLLLRVGSNNAIGWLPNLDGQGSFGLFQVIATFDVGHNSLKCADINQDGLLDVVVGTNDGLFWIENLNGQGSFGEAQTIADASVGKIEVIRIDDDDFPDVVAGLGREMHWYRNPGTSGGIWIDADIQPDLMGLGSTQNIIGKDLDLDGDTDLVVSWGGIRDPDLADILLFENENGNGDFGAYESVPVEVENISDLEVADMNGDGLPDLLLSSSSSSQVVWVRNEGPVSIAPRQEYESRPNSVVLEPAFPNPFNPATRIPFRISSIAKVQLDLYSVNGRRVKSLVDGVLPAGQHAAFLQADGLASGVYFVTLRSNGVQQSQKILLLK